MKANYPYRYHFDPRSGKREGTGRGGGGEVEVLYSTHISTYMYIDI